MNETVPTCESRYFACGAPGVWVISEPGQTVRYCWPHAMHRIYQLIQHAPEITAPLFAVSYALQPAPGEFYRWDLTVRWCSGGSRILTDAEHKRCRMWLVKLGDETRLPDGSVINEYWHHL